MKNLFYILRMAVVALCAVALLWPFYYQDDNLPPDLTSAHKPTPSKKAVPEKPLHNVKLPNFAKIRDIPTKKRTFFEFLKPAVVAENNAIRQLRQQILEIQEVASLDQALSQPQEQLLAELVKKYKVNKRFSQMRQIDELLVRVDIIPSALILVQAANESAWGTSRFARIGLNFFGMWCFKKGCGMVPNGRDTGAKHEVAAYSSVKHAVQRYVHNINTNNAYMVFRSIRAQLREQELPLSPQVLATGLLPYSERGTDYVLEISAMIRQNQKYLSN
ncbi:glucosaminidase domain-containing protein [Thalassotalea fusca]